MTKTLQAVLVGAKQLLIVFQTRKLIVDRNVPFDVTEEELQSILTQGGMYEEYKEHKKEGKIKDG